MLLDNLSYFNTAISIMKSCFYESIPTAVWRSIDFFYSVMNNIEDTELYHEAVAERQELHPEEVDVDSERSLDDRQLNPQIGVRRQQKLKEWIRGSGVSRKEQIAVHTRAIRRAVLAGRKGNMRKGTGSVSTARRMQQSKM
jgi:hypothetical protein